MASTDTIDLPLNDLATPEQWGSKAYVYAPSLDEFYITQEKHKALEVAAKRKFEAKVIVRDNIVYIVLPAEFARAFMWQREAAITKIVYGEKMAICVFAGPAQKK